MPDETGPTPEQPTSGQPTPPAAGQPPAAAVPPPPPPAAAVPPPPSATEPLVAAPAPPPAAVVPPAPPAGYGQAAPPGEAPMPAKKRGVGMRIARIVASVVVVLLIGVAWKAYQNHHATASAPEKGECVQAKDTTTDHPSVTKVDCSDSAADFVVLDKIEGGSSTSCDTVEGTEAAFTSTRGSTSLYVLCLKHK